MPPPEHTAFEPTIGHNFGIEVEAIVQGVFSECSGISGEVKIEQYEQGGETATTRKLPGRASFGNVTLKRGVTHDRKMLKWFLDVTLGTFKRNDITIIAFDREGKPIQRWTLRRAFPVKYSAPPMQASGNQVDVESVEFAHEGVIMS